jgi:hypothetical protein
MSLYKLLLIPLLLIFALSVSEAQSFNRPSPPRQQKSVSKKPLNKSRKEKKITGSRSVRKAIKKQSANDKRLKKEYEQFVKNNQKRSLEIQTPEVRERMKQNVKDANSRYKAKKKKNSSKTRQAAKKYK